MELLHVAVFTVEMIEFKLPYKIEIKQLFASEREYTALE